jgi:aminoglycoside phosphotransferase
MAKKKLVKPKMMIIFEGMLCCSTGLCGPEPNQALIQLNEDVKKLKEEFPKRIIRASLSFNAEAFLECPEVLALVKDKGTGILPITVLDGKVLAKQKYMTYAQMRAALSGAK